MLTPKYNLTNYASRWMTTYELLNSTERTPMPLTTSDDSLHINGHELKKLVVHTIEATPVETADFRSRLEYFSSWHNAKRAIAVYMHQAEEQASRTDCAFTH